MKNAPHKALILNTNLYPTRVVNTYTLGIPKWSLLSDKSKEKILSHIMTCIYSCNMQLWNREESEQEDVSRKRKREQYSPKPSTSGTQKRFKSHTILDDLGMEIETGSNTDSSDGESEINQPSMHPSTSTSTDPEIEEKLTEEYKFIMIRYVPGGEALQNSLCDEWEIPKIPFLLDVANREMKIFLKVEISQNFSQAIENFNCLTEGYEKYTGLYLINPSSAQTFLHRHPDEIPGAAKVTLFHINRAEVMRRNNILETEMIYELDILNKTLCSETFNEWVSEWESTWTSPINEKYTIDELYGGITQIPKTLTPEKLLSSLTTLEENWRSDIIRYKGKILIDPWCDNIKTTLDTDKDMVSLFLGILSDELDEKIISTTHVNYNDGNEMSESVLHEVLDLWRNDKATTFSLLSYKKRASIEGTLLAKYLGVGKKKMVYNEALDDAQQPTYKELPNLRYHPWINDLFEDLNKPHEQDAQLTSKMWEKAPCFGHPMAHVCEETVEKIIPMLCNTNTTLTSSRLTNLYSRLGGAYTSREGHGKETRNNIAILPLYSVLNETESNGEELLSP